MHDWNKTLGYLIYWPERKILWPIGLDYYTKEKLTCNTGRSRINKIMWWCDDKKTCKSQESNIWDLLTMLEHSLLFSSLTLFSFFIYLFIYFLLLINVYFCSHPHQSSLYGVGDEDGGNEDDNKNVCLNKLMNKSEYHIDVSIIWFAMELKSFSKISLLALNLSWTFRIIHISPVCYR